MNEEQELKPLTKGAVTVGSSEREKLDFPVAKMIKVHVSDAKFGKFAKTVEDEDGSKKEIEQTKVLYTFTVDDDIKDETSKESLKGKSFVKGITLSSHERATYPGFIAAVNGGNYSADPADALDKPLQVMFSAWAEFNGQKYQPVTYLPPAEGQEAPSKDNVISESEFDKIFPDAKEVK